MPSYGMYTAEGTLVRWLKPTGAEVAAREVIAEIETEKATADVAAPADGILHQIAEPGTLLQVQSLMGYILAPGENPPERRSDDDDDASAVPAPTPTPPPALDRDLARASPNARRLASELGVELTGLAGTGPGGRITEDDVRAAFEDTN